MRHVMGLQTALAVVTLVAAGAQAELYIAPFGSGGYRLYETIGTGNTWVNHQAAAAAKVDPVTGSGLTGNLARIDSQAENDFLQAISTGSSRFIGANDQAVEGEWRWVNNGDQFWQGAVAGSPVGGRYSNWNSNEPNNYGSGEDIAEFIGSTGRWNDQSATHSIGAFYQWELAGLTDATTSGEALRLDPTTGNYYQRSSTAVNFNTAKALAESRELLGTQGRLVQVTSRAQSRFLGSLGGGWSGLTDNELYGGAEAGNGHVTGWVWTNPVNSSGQLTSTPVASTGVTLWATGEPNNSSDEDGMEIRTDGLWNDNKLSTTRNALIEFQTGVARNFELESFRNTGGVSTVNDVRDVLNGKRTITGHWAGEYAAVNFGSAGGVMAGAARFPGTEISGVDNFASRISGAIVIETPGTYTFGVSRDDIYELVIDRGGDVVVTGSGGCCGEALVTATFDQPGTYNVSLLHGDGGGDERLEFFAAAGDYSSFTYADAVTAGANFQLVGDTLNGGLATAAARNIGVSNPFNVVHKADPSVVSFSSANTLLDNAGVPGLTGSYDVVNFHDTGSNGHYGNDSAFLGNTGADDNNFAVEATAMLMVAEDGWWTFGVLSDDGFSLEIANHDFTSFAGDVDTDIVGGLLRHINNRGTEDSLGHIFLTAGLHELTLRYWENTGGATLELFYAAGINDSFNGSFKLLTVIPTPGAAGMGTMITLALAAARRHRRA